MMKHLCRIFALGWFSIFMMSTLPTLAQEQTNLTTDSQQALATLPSAQTSLIGTLLEQGTNKPIVGASITLVNQNIVTETNEEGNFQLSYLEAGDEEIIIEADGYISTVELTTINLNTQNDCGTIYLQVDMANDVRNEILLNLAEQDLNDDEGRTQEQASAASSSTDVFNNVTSFAWSTMRYRNRGYEQIYEQNYIEGISFNSAERGQFNFSAMGGLNDASRYKETTNAIEANNFAFGGIGNATNYLMAASNYAQGWKASVAGTNRNYKAAVRASYNSGPLNNGWTFMGQVAFRFSPYIDNKGIIGEGIKYYSLGYFFSAEKVWNRQHKLKLITFGAPTLRGQSAAVTQETYDLTNQYNKTTWGWNNYNPYWGYQDGEVRNSRLVKTYDPTVIVGYEYEIDETSSLHIGLGYHYSMYSNSALSFYNAPDPRPDYYRNLPSFLWDGQLTERGTFITKDLNDYELGRMNEEGALLFNQSYNGTPIGHSIDLNAYKALHDLWTSRDDRTTQIDWDALYRANYANNYANPNGSAKYIQERRHNDIQEGMLSLNYANSKFEHLKITAGLEAKQSEGIHFKTIDDLLGGKQWLDVDPFAERDIAELATNIGLTQAQIAYVMQNDIKYYLDNNSPKAITTGGRFAYDYRINMTNINLWAQNEWSWNSVDLYYALKLSYSNMQRTTDMFNGRAYYLTAINPSLISYYLGDRYSSLDNLVNDIPNRLHGTMHHFFDPSFKLGLKYKINGRNHIKINALAETKAPLARDAYISPRVHDRAIGTIYQHDQAQSLSDFYAASQKIVSGDITYEFNYPIVRGRVTGFYTQFWNASELNGYYDDEARTFVNQAMYGINRRHMGLEAAIAVKLGTYFTLSGVVAAGDYSYIGNAYCITSAENGMALGEKTNLTTGVIEPIYELKDSVLVNGLKVSNGPQLNASLKLSFFHPKMWFADITVSYFDRNWLDFAPARRMKGLFYGTRTDGTVVNGGFNQLYIDNTTSTDVRQHNADGSIALDQYGIPLLEKPYNYLVEQESMVHSNPWHRFLIDLSIGKLIYLENRQSLSINLSVSNVTNNVYMKTGGYQQARLPRATRQGVLESEGNSTITSNIWKFPSKYYYAWGTNFYMTITYKF